MKRIFEMACLAASTAAVAWAGSIRAPEIDAASGAAALTLLAGGMLVLRSRRRR